MQLLYFSTNTLNQDLTHLINYNGRCNKRFSAWLHDVSISTDLKDKTTERKRILSEINLDTEMFMTSFDKAARLLTEQKEKLEKQGWTSVHLKMEYSHDWAELKAYGMRLENDTEFNKRKEAEEKKLKAAERKAERERKKYEELKLKYGEQY